MEKHKQLPTCAEVKRQDLVAYLAHLGFAPQKISGPNYWYCSPLRKENTPSFKVDRRLNRWYDHGTGLGGNLVDFGIQFYHCTVGEFLVRFGETGSPVGHLNPSPAESTVDSAPKKITIVQASALNSLVLQRYIRARRIPPLIAARWCKEVVFQLGEKQYRAIGFQNDAGGYELRNQWFKGSSSPKTSTHIQNGANKVAVFEGFFDFLSYLSITHQQEGPRADYLVLHSLAFFPAHCVHMERYQSVHLFLDRDDAGIAITRSSLAQGTRYRDESALYRGYKDLNDWHQHMGKGPGRKMGLSSS